MNRNKMLETLKGMQGFWDVVVVGGGATGLGAAVESASRGYKTLLLEQHDFAKATSSRSTKLVHGGVRYLQQGNIALVLEALHERGLMLQNAPHLVQNQAFIVPNYAWWSGPFYGAGLKVYDLLAGRLGFGPSKLLSREETMALIPTLEPKDLHGGVIYYDGQFDDSRLAVNLAQTVADLGGTVINYMPVLALMKANQIVCGVTAKDLESKKEYEIHSHVVINATGIFTDSVLHMDDPQAECIMALSQGVHLVLDREFLPGDSAVMVPQTEDGRVLFAVPWHRKVVVGTTDTPVEQPTLEPRPLQEEIEFILHHAAKYLSKDPSRADVLSVFAGIRPLVSLSHRKDTAGISRDHHVIVSESGLVTIAGGKWTTYRKMAEDTINQAALVGGLETMESKTRDLRIHGWLESIDPSDPFYFYGSDALSVRRLIEQDSSLGAKLHDQLPYTGAEVVWAVRHEMARSVEDVLARRTRALLLNAKASQETASEVARIMAKELGRDEKWRQQQVEAYHELAAGYQLN
ncbi:MAG: glycerol-3-phosphate dehydrogenase/oxidase [Desulfoferrobacter sp.]